MRSLFFYLFLFSVHFCSCQKSIQEETTQLDIELSEPIPGSKMNGLSFVAPPRPFPENPMPKVKAVGANWVAVIPYGYMRKGEAQVGFGQHDWQWWGETPDGAEATIQLAQENGLNVLLKPQVYIHNSWTGDVYFSDEEKWKVWEETNEKYILVFAEIAQKYNVPAFCIGTEWKRTVDKREDYWRSLIAKVRKIYKGKLVYASNWDEWDSVPFWDALDYIGINAYFPLMNEEVPKVKELKKAWAGIEKKLAAFSKKHQRKIIFTEFGYMSVENCAHQTWVLEKNRKKLVYSEKAQANAMEALYATFMPKDYWVGSFLWKWYPNEFAGRRMVKDYTPQGKLSEEVLQKWFLKKKYAN